MRFRLTQKGLLLVGIPLIFELSLFAGMLNVASQSETTAQQALHAKKVGGAVNKVVADSLQFLGTIKMLSAPDLLMINRVAHQIKQLRRDEREFREIVGNDSRYKPYTDALAAMDGQLERSIQNLLPVAESGDIRQLSMAINSDRGEWTRVIEQGHAIEMIKSASDVDAQMVDEEPRQQAKLRQQLKILLGFGVAVSIAVSIALAVFFTRQVTRRLGVIQDNNERLLTERPLNPIVSGSDEIADLDLAFHRMTEDLMYARERERAAQELRDRVVAMVSHDLRRPLQTINTFLECLDDAELEEEYTRFKAIAERNVRSMARLLDDLLDLDRLEAGAMPLNKTTFFLSAAVAQANELVLAAAKEKKVVITVSGESSLVADERRIVQVLTNLLDNAIKYSQLGGVVKVDIVQERSAAKVSVADQGRGIPPESLASVFEPFRQAKDSDADEFGGSGLGLAICKEIIEGHRGKIQVSSNPGRGSVFCFIIPMPQ
jgi:signal transduction histidine kinase